MIELRLITNLSDLSNDKCIMCSKCKITCNSFNSVERSMNVLNLIHSDIYEMTNIFTRKGKRYFITFINNVSKYIRMYFL